MSEFKIIQASSSEDVKILQELGRDTFLEAFSDDNTTENINNYVEKNFTKEKIYKECLNKESLFYMIKRNGVAVGYLKLNYGDSQKEPLGNKALEIERIYIFRAFQGNKLGNLLIQKSIEVAQNKALDFIWLGVWENNLKAIGFYERNGFIPFGSHDFQFGNELQRDILMKLIIKN